MQDKQTIYILKNHTLGQGRQVSGTGHIAIDMLFFF